MILNGQNMTDGGCFLKKNGAVQKVSKPLLRRYTLPKFQTLEKLIALIINYF